MKTSNCELERLGEDAQSHEELKTLIDEQYNRMRPFSCRPSRYDNLVARDIAYNNKNYLEQLIKLRKKHGLPYDGKCFQCSGDRCL